MSDRRSGQNRHQSALRRQKEQYILESRDECDCDDCCCDCCNYRCWAIFLLIFKIIANVSMVIFGGWAINSWAHGVVFGVIILLVSIISLLIHIIALYGVVQGLSAFIYVGLVYECIKLFFDVIYGICLGAIISAEYFGSAVGWVIFDCFMIWILWRQHKLAERVESDFQ